MHNPGDKIIWDSGFGYEVGYFVKPKGTHYDTHTVDLKTGKYVQGMLSVAPYEIKPYSELDNVSNKYGYRKELKD